MGNISVIILESDQIVREGVKGLLAEDDGILLAGEACRGEELFPLLAKTDPHILIMGGHVLESYDQPTRLLAVAATIEQVGQQYPNTRVILVAEHYIPLTHQAMLEQGVRGFVLRRDALSHALPQAVRTVHGGGVFCTETARRELFHPVTWGKQYHLNERQVAALAALIAQPEASRHELARLAGLRVMTFDYHLKHVMEVLGAKTRLAVVLRAFQLGIFRVEEL